MSNSNSTSGGDYEIGPKPTGEYMILRPTNSKPVLIITAEGEIKLGEGCANVEAAQALVDLANKMRTGAPATEFIKTEWHCNECRGTNLVSDAPTRWNFDKQKWVIDGEVYEQTYCEDCEINVRVTAVPVML